MIASFNVPGLGDSTSSAAFAEKIKFDQRSSEGYGWKENYSESRELKHVGD